MKKFGIGLIGGVLGGALAFGGAYVVLDSNTSNTPNSSVTTSSSNSKDKQTTPISYDVESDTTKAVEKVQDAVVSVINLQKQQENNSEFNDLFGMDSPTTDSTEASGALETSSEGSGVIYKKDKDDKFAYVVTNNHVVEGSDAIEVLLSDGTQVEATLVGRDTYTDLAVLKISGEHVKTVAEFGDSDALKVGEPAIAIGSPLGSEYASSVTQGIISAKNRAINDVNENQEAFSINAIQTDAAINPGNSGGALVNAAGQVIGINSIKIASSTSGVSTEGMGFAIPSNDVVTIISQLEEDGTVTRPKLGVAMRDLATISSEQRKEILSLDEKITQGVIIVDVETATPAEKAGLKEYDVIVEMDGKPVETGSDLQSILYGKKVGDSVSVTYYRGTDKKTVDIELKLSQNASKE